MGEIHLSEFCLSANHPGVTEHLSGAYSEAARVCLSRHHSSPVALDCSVSENRRTTEVHWDSPSQRTRNAWANADDATRDGAYAIALLVMERELQLVAIARAETRTGADYYLAPIGQEHYDLERAFRLEVSGLDHGTEAQLDQRLRQKVVQAQRGSSNLPAFAAVVGFRIAALRAVPVER